MKLIKVGFLVSYDYELLKISLPRIYADADQIAMAVDIHRRTWSGNVIEIPGSFFDWLKEVDTDHKISIYEDDFYKPELSTKDNDTRERNMLAKFMGEGGWHVQVDADEYFVDFPEFCHFLRSLPTDGKLSVNPRFITTFKQLPEGYLYVSGNDEHYPVATNYPEYTGYRGNMHNETVFSNHLIIHESWSRSETDLQTKLANWSHNADFDVQAYYKLWKAINAGNYKYVNDFHPLSRDLWPHLSLAKGKNMADVIDHIGHLPREDRHHKELLFAAGQPLLPVFREKMKNKLGSKGYPPAHEQLPPYRKGSMDHTIKVGMLVSYDYDLLKISLPRLYASADSITLAIDHQRRTWSGNVIDIPDSFFTWLKELDTAQKIRIYEDDFYAPELSVKDNDTRERNMLAQYMGAGGWHVQIDADEYFRDFGAFCSFLKQLHPAEPVTVRNLSVTIFKQVADGYLYVSGSKEYYAMATNYPVYTAYRNNENNRVIFSDFLVLHESWARSEEALMTKLRNWSHREHFNVMDYFALWQVADRDNCRYINNFHPMIPERWRHLEFIAGRSMEEIIDMISLEDVLQDFKTDIQKAAAQPLLPIIREKLKQKFSLKK